MKHILRHGDVILVPITKEEFEKAKAETVANDGSVILAFGETTGHKHVLIADRMEVKRAENGRYYLSVQSGGKLSHEEHGTLTVEPETYYRQGQEREFDHFQRVVRKVVD